MRSNDGVLRCVAAVAGAVGCLAVSISASGIVAAGVTGSGCWLAVAWLQARPRRASLGQDLPLVLDLLAAALCSGRAVADALDIAAQAAEQVDAGAADWLRRVGALLRLGADPAEAWRGDGSSLEEFATISRVAARSSASGARLAAAFERLAEQLRSQLAAQARARAHRAGVLTMLPLGLCYLPAFVCLGIVPVVAGIARSTFGAVG